MRRSGRIVESDLPQPWQLRLVRQLRALRHRLPAAILAVRRSPSMSKGLIAKKMAAALKMNEISALLKEPWRKVEWLIVNFRLPQLGFGRSRR